MAAAMRYPRKSGGRGRPRQTNSPSPASNSMTCDLQRGTVVWAKVRNARWWPAMIVSKDDCVKLATTSDRPGYHFIYWYGDGRISQIAKSNMVEFMEGFQRYSTPRRRTSFESGVYLAISDLRKMNLLEVDVWNPRKAFLWADEGFPHSDDAQNTKQTSGCISEHVQGKLRTLRSKHKDELESDHDISFSLEISPQQKELNNSIRNGTVTLEKICISCFTRLDERKDHPLFEGSICESCMNKLLEGHFSIGLDSVAFHCSICMSLGDLIVCSRPHCFRAYCSKCIMLKAALGAFEIIRESDPWHCFLCAPHTELHGLLKPRKNWKLNLWNLFHPIDRESLTPTKSVNVLCFDDSCSTVLTVLSNLASSKLKVDTVILCNFGNSELMTLKSVLPQNVVHKNSITEYIEYEALSKFPPIHVVIASSQAEKEKEELGTKFFNFHTVVSMLRILQAFHSEIPLMWVFEVDVSEWHDYHILISRYLEFEAAVRSEGGLQTSKKLVWTNVPPLWKILEGDGVPQTNESLQELTRYSELKSVDKRQATDVKCKPLEKSETSKLNIVKDNKRKERKRIPAETLTVTRSKRAAM